MEPDNSNIIYPTNIKKYVGSIIHYGDKYRYKLKHKKLVFTKTFDNFDDAINYKKQKSNKLNLTKNIIFDRGDHYEMVLTKGKLMKFDKDDIELANKYIWYCNGVNYCYNSYIGKCFQYFVINNNDDTIIYHINKDSLDNRKSNLISINKSIMCINSNNINRNTSGFIGVSYDINKNYWVSQYYSNGEQIRKSFSCVKYGDEEAMKLAIKFRENIIKQIDSYKESDRIDKKRKISHDSNS